MVCWFDLFGGWRGSTWLVVGGLTWLVVRGSSWSVVGGWLVVADGWWLVAGGWWLVGWWLVVGGWWLVAGGWTGLGWLDWTWLVGRLWSCSVSCLVFAVCGGWGCFRLVLFVPWCCLGVWCLHVALAFAVVLPWFGDAWCCFGSIGAARLLGGVAWWCCLVLLGWLGVGASTATGVDG